MLTAASSCDLFLRQHESVSSKGRGQQPRARAQTLKPELGQAPSDEHFLLEDNKYIADVLADFRERKSRDTQSKAR